MGGAWLRPSGWGEQTFLSLRNPDLWWDSTPAWCWDICRMRAATVGMLSLVAAAGSHRSGEQPQACSGLRPALQPSAAPPTALTTPPAGRCHHLLFLLLPLLPVSPADGGNGGALGFPVASLAANAPVSGPQGPTVSLLGAREDQRSWGVGLG